MIYQELYDFLEAKYHYYNLSHFIENDPVSIPHRFKKKQDIEISGFLAATLSWGQRPVIIRNTSYLMELMDNSPHEFVKGFTKKDLTPFQGFTHRTFKGEDCCSFLIALKRIYHENDSLENFFYPEKMIKITI